MSERIHGHVVLEAILAESAPIPRSQLTDAMATLHGMDARYHTCSASDMTLQDLLEFLLERGKISESADGIVAHREQMCTHG